MSMLKRLDRFNPLRIFRAPDAVSRLEAAAATVRQDQKAMSREVRALTRLVEQLQKTVHQHQVVVTDGLPALQATLRQCEARIEQCIGAYTKDAMYADLLPQLRERLGSPRVERHAAAAVQRAVLETDPGAHIVIDDLLPEDLADELVAAVPPSLFFPNGNMTRQEIGVPFFFAPEYNRVVWGVFSAVLERAILPAVVEKFRPALDDFMRRNWPGLGSFADSGVTLRVINSRIMLRRPGYRIKPHRDPRWAFLTCLVYLQKRDDAPHTYGTQFYRLRAERQPAHHSPLWMDDDEVTLVKEVLARRNAAVVFLNSTGAHGAFIPPDAPPETERFIYQVQFGPDDRSRRMLVAALEEGPARNGWTTARGTGQ